MPTWRKLHVKATESLDINDMPDDFHRLLWVMLPLGLDREGRGLDNPAWVKAKIMPLRVDVTPDMVSAAMEWYETRGMIERYQVNGRAYFWLPTFVHYQGNNTREAESEYPAPPAKSTLKACNGQDQVVTNSRPTQDQVATNSGLDVDVDVDVERDVDTDTDGSAAADVSPSLEEYVKRGVRVFENAIGMLSGSKQSKEISDTLRELHEHELYDWWQTAIDIAVDNNKRSWGYIHGILENHLQEKTPPVRKAGPIRASPEPQKRVVIITDPETGERTQREVTA